MSNRTADNVKAGLNGLRGTGDVFRSSSSKTAAADPTSHSNPLSHHSTPTKTHAVAQEKGDEMPARAKHVEIAQDVRKQPQQPPTLPPAAHNYDEAPPGQPGPDFSGSVHAAAGAAAPVVPVQTTQFQKPAFTRGPSMLDGTAVTSAAPTPAGEIPNPMAYNTPATATRQRESHLPDLDLRDAEVYGGGSGGGAFDVEEGDDEEPDDEVRGEDAFAPEAARQGTGKRPRRGTMSQG